MANTAVVYDRKIDDKLLHFEASGALKNAALVMRDRETDSWWSIMTSDAIGGSLDGTNLVELPVGEKTTWADWRRHHPDTLVLSVEGEEHVDNNPYDNYFASEGTFRDLAVEDQRLAAKDPIYAFWLDGGPRAVSHAAFRGGRLFELDGLEGRRLLLFRSRKAPIYESSRAFLVDAALASSRKPRELLHLAEAGDTEGVEALPGFDTFWYTWVATNEDTHLID